MEGMVSQPTPDVQGPTRERLLAAGMRLFSEKGFRATTVGEIEAAVGLVPRRGALYRHFPTKQALLEAGIQRHLDAVEAASHVVGAAQGLAVRDVASFVGHWLLTELDAERHLTHILEHDGHRLPELTERVREHVSDAGYRATAGLIHEWLGAAAETTDVEALSVVLLSPLINLRRSTWTFSRPPLGLDDARLVDTWADTCSRVVASIRADVDRRDASP